MTDAILEEILEEIAVEEPICIDCKEPMATVRQWRAASIAERNELRDEGLKAPGTEELCGVCRDIKSGRRNTPEQREAKKLARKTALFEPIRQARASGATTSREIADIVGIKISSVPRIIRRAEEMGVTL